MLSPLNPATCPACGSKKTARMAYDLRKKASAWKCKNEECGRVFHVPTLVLAKKVS
jgi:transposase-like protein